MEETKPTSRKKFIFWGASVFTAAAAFKFFKPFRRNTTVPAESDKIKMLTQDGKLVEIDKKLLAQGTKKISTNELKQWVNKTPQ